MLQVAQFPTLIQLKIGERLEISLHKIIYLILQMFLCFSPNPHTKVGIQSAIPVTLRQYRLSLTVSKELYFTTVLLFVKHR